MATNYYDYVSEKGIIVPDTGDVLSDVQAEFKSVFPDMDVETPETPQGRLIEAMAGERSSAVAFAAANANQLNLDYATGVFLDVIGSFFRVSRVGARSTRVLATLTGTAGTVIPANSLAKTTAGDKFYLETETTIGSGGTASAYFLSVDLGAIACDTGTLTSIVSAMLGWTAITNGTAAAIGTDEESDTAYRIRIKASRYTGSSFVESIKSELNKIGDLVSSFAYDNGTSSPVVYDGVTIAAHSVFVIADGGADADIAEAIFKTKDAGCAYTAIRAYGTITISVQTSDGDTVTVGGATLGKTYRFKNTPAQAYDVQIGSDAEETLTNLFEAINASGTEGVEYYAGTLANPIATATNPTATTVVCTAYFGDYGIEDLLAKVGTNIAVTNTQIEQSVTEQVIDGAYSVEYDVIFNRPQEIQIDVEITVAAQNYSGDDLEADVKAAILSWAAGEVEGVDGLTIGRDVSPFEVASAVSFMVPAPFVSDCKVCLHGGSPAATTINIDSKSVARVVEGNITVTVS